MSGASEALQAAAMAALGAIEGLGVYEGQPLQAAFPYAVAETGPEADWSHKSGQGRDIRLAIILYDKGERPGRLRTLAAEAEEALSALGGDMGGWRLVTMPFLRSRLVRDVRGAEQKGGAASGQGWTAMIEYRARMLRTH
jgi:hypothetical protein